MKKGADTVTAFYSSVKMASVRATPELARNYWTKPMMKNLAEAAVELAKHEAKTIRGPFG